MIPKCYSANGLFDTFFRNVFDGDSDWGLLSNTNIKYPADVWEDQRGLTIELAVTGGKRDDIEIEMKDSVLKISYNKPSPKEGEDENKRYYWRKIGKSSFSFEWKIPSRFDSSRIDAKLNNGLLEVFLPILPEVESKKITIK